MDTVQIHDAVNEEIGHIENQLFYYNSTKVHFDKEPPFLHINRCIKDGNEVVGGILTKIYWNILYVDILWVKDEYRHKGYATALLTDVENTAKEMNCKISHLETFEFQAKGLYEKFGYTVFGVLEDCPEGHIRYSMSKKLV
ncbi:MAG: GNAT family N-acetyltransferase [Eubacteriales bacterium]